MNINMEIMLDIFVVLGIISWFFQAMTGVVTGLISNPLAKNILLDNFVKS